MRSSYPNSNIRNYGHQHHYQPTSGTATTTTSRGSVAATAATTTMRQRLPPQQQQTPQQKFEEVADLLSDLPQNTTTTTTKPSMLWSAICRDDILLVEAYHDHADGTDENVSHNTTASSSSSSKKEIHEASRVLLQKRPTPGWEYATFGRRNGSTKLKGMKFHVYDHCGLIADVVPPTHNINNNNSNNKGGGRFRFRQQQEQAPSRPPPPSLPPQNAFQEDVYYDRRRRFVVEQHDAVPDFQKQKALMDEMDNVMATTISNSPVGGLTVWTFACIYDPSLVETDQARAFLERIVSDTDMFRQPSISEYGSTTTSNGGFNNNNDDDDDFINPFHYSSNNNKSDTPPESLWRYGSDHALQDGFAPMLLYRMDDVAYLGKLAVCHQRLDSLKNVMAKNIELILERDVQLERMNAKTTELNEMAKVFAKRSKDVKRKMMWNNAIHGAALGAAITAGVAIVVVPLILL